MVRGHFVRWFVIVCVLTGGLIAPAQEQSPASGFRDRTAELGLQLANAKACSVDVDNDGKFDLFVGNFAHVDGRGDQPKSRFLRNLGAEKGHTFEDRGLCGVFYQEPYASPTAGDFDNDGDLDLFFTTVYGTASFGRPNNPVLFRNDGGFVFADAKPSAKLTSNL